MIIIRHAHHSDVGVERKGSHLEAKRRFTTFIRCYQIDANFSVGWSQSLAFVQQPAKVDER